MLRRSLLGALALSLVATNAARAGWRAERTRWWPRIDAVGAAAVDDSTFVLRTHGWIGRAHWDSNSVELGKLRPVAMHGEAVWASGGMAYATSSPGVLDVFDLETLSLVNQVDLGDGIEDGNVYTYGFAQNGDRLYVALFGGGISLLDASEPMAPILVANTPSRGAPWFGPTRLELMDNMLISAEAGLGWGIYSLDAAGVPTMEHYEWLGGYDRDIEPLPGRRVGVAGDEILGIYSIDQNYQPHLIGSEWRHQARFTGLERYGPLAALSSWHHRYPNDICPQGFGFYAYTFWNLQTDPWGTEHRLTIPTNDCGASTGTFHRLSDNGLVLLDRGGGFRALEIDEGGEQIREIGSIAKQGRVYDAVINDSLLVSAESRYGGYRWVIDREGEVIEGAYELPRGDARNFWTADLDHESGRIFLGYSSFSAGDTIAIMEVWGDTLIRVGEIEESAANGMWFHEGILYGRLSRVWAYDLREFPEVRYLNTYDDSWGLDLAVTPGDSIDAMYMVGDDLFDGDVSVVSLNRDSGEMQLHEKIEVDYAAWGVASSDSILAISNNSGYIYIYTLEDRFSPTFRFRYKAAPGRGVWVNKLQLAGGVLLATRDTYYAPYDSLLAYQLREDHLKPVASWPLNLRPFEVDAKLLSDGTVRAAVALGGAGILDVRLSRDQVVMRQPQLESKGFGEVVLPRKASR